jgi:hypothetical protein
MHLPVMRRHCHSEGNQGSRAGPDQKKRAGRWHRYWMKIKINIPSSAGTGCHPASPGIPSRASAVSDGPRRPRAGSPRTSPAAGCSPQISSDLCCSRDGMDVAGEEEHRGGAEEPSANAIPSTEGESEGGGFRRPWRPTQGHGASIRRGGSSGHAVVVRDFFFRLPVGVQLTGISGME